MCIAARSGAEQDDPLDAVAVSSSSVLRKRTSTGSFGRAPSNHIQSLPQPVDKAGNPYPHCDPPSHESGRGDQHDQTRHGLTAAVHHVDQNIFLDIRDASCSCYAHAAHAAIAATVLPDPATPGADRPRGFTHLLGLVRRLIDYGKDLATTLQQLATNADLAAATLSFGTRDIAPILARITRGLLLANALEGKLVELAARPEEPPKPTRPPNMHRVCPGRQPRGRAARPTLTSPRCPRPSRSPPRSAAGRSAL